MSQTWIIGAFLISMAYMLVTIIKFKMNAFYSLLSGSFILAFLIRMPLTDINGAITGGFAGALGALGIVVALGAILGSLLSMSGATEQLAAGVLRAAGKERSSLAMNIIGFIISIPVYMGSAYIILNPLCKNLSRDTKKNVIVYTTALSIGLLVTHCLVIPTPGPLAVANTLGIDIGWFILYALLVSIAASLTGGWLYGEFMGKKYPYEELIEDLKEDTAEATDPDKKVPSFALSVSLISFLLILLSIFHKYLYLMISPVNSSTFSTGIYPTSCNGLNTSENGFPTNSLIPPLFAPITSVLQASASKTVLG